MDKEDKKRRMGQSVAFYTALAVCLIAVGVGTWQLLQPESAAPDAQSGTAAVSSSAALPDASSAAPEASVSPDASETDAAAVMGPDAPEASDAEAQAVSGAASVAKTDAKNADASKDAGSASGAKDAGNTAKTDAKSGASSNSKSAESSNAKSGSSSNGKSAASGAKSGASSKSSKTSGDAVRPVEGAVVTAYSMDKLLYNETMRDWRTHDGIDIAADAGTAVVAAKAGTVESVEADPIMGMTVTIQHQDKWETVYSSLTDAPEVEAGDEVTAGQVIGFVGETAASESALGPHLHFAVLHDGAASDPESFLA